MDLLVLVDLLVQVDLLVLADLLVLVVPEVLEHQDSQVFQLVLFVLGDPGHLLLPIVKKELEIRRRVHILQHGSRGIPGTEVQTS